MICCHEANRYDISQPILKSDTNYLVVLVKVAEVKDGIATAFRISKMLLSNLGVTGGVNTIASPLAGQPRMVTRFPLI